mmetsp:Transcript_11827/g.18163  ORF Transcript_11827/g.18163 Transcript_11827/m.18163 type:complete len:218 (+) Transcript_11827:161-814(+)
MKLSNIATTTTLLLLSSEAYASHEETSTHTLRMRSVKIYSSTPQRNPEFGKDIVDPYIGLPDERELEQRGLAKRHKKPTAVSVPNPIPSLEMSMPAVTSMPSQSQVLSYPLKGSTSTKENDVLPYQRRLKKQSKPSAEKVSVPTLEMSMPTGASMPVQTQSFSDSLEDSISTGENDILIRRRAAEEETFSSAMTTSGSLAIAAAAIVSAIVGAVVLL